MLFARRRSSSLYDKFSCLNIAFVTTCCCLLVIVGHVQSMSLDRLGSTRQSRQFQQQNDKQLEFSESMVPEAESELLQNDMELVTAAEDGLSDMYLLVPAGGSNAGADNSIEEQNLQSVDNTEQLQQAGKVSLTPPANEESNSDMLMLESVDTPAVQILQLPEDVLETKLSDDYDVVAPESENQAEEEQVQSENMVNTLAEVVQEIKNEIETELVEQPSPEEEKAQEVQQLNELPMEHKDNAIEMPENLSALEANNLEQEMIGVVKEEPVEKTLEQVNEVMDMQADESEVQPVAMEMNNESVDQLPAEENKIEEEAAIMSPEMSEEKIETISQEASETMENVKPIEDTEAEIEKNETEEQHQDDPEAEEMKDESETSGAVGQEAVSEALLPEKEEIQMDSADESHAELKIEMPAVEQIQAEDVHSNQNEMEETPLTNEIQADDETQEAIDVSEIVSNENQNSKVETVVEAVNEEESPSVDETQMPVEADELDKEQSAEVTQSDDELQQLDSNENSVAEENPVEEVLKTGSELIAESQILNAEEEVKPAEDNMQPEMIEEVQQIVAVQPAEEVAQDINEQNDDVEPSAEEEENKESPLVEENQIVEETQSLEQAQSIADHQADQTVAETERVEAQAEGEIQTLQETQPVREAETTEVAEAMQEPDTLPETVEEYQPMEVVQDVQHDVEESQPMEATQTLQDDAEEVQPVANEIQAIIEDAQPMEETQAVEQQQQPMEEVQAMEEAPAIEEAQAMEEVQTLQDDVEEIQPVANEIQAMIEDAQPMEEAQPVQEVQSMEEVKPVESVAENQQTLEHDQPIEEIKSEEVETQPMEDIKPLEDSLNLTNGQPIEEEAESENENKSEEIKPEEELQTPGEIQADEDSEDVNVPEAMVEDIKPVEIVAGAQSLNEEAEPMEQQETVISEEKPAEIIVEDNADKQNEDTSTAEASADELVVANKIPAEVENDNQNQEVQPIILANEDTLQNVETNGDDEQKDETPEAEIQKPLEDKDSDNILNDDTNESETTSMLTTIVQVPTKDEQTQTPTQHTQQSEEQQEAVVETTFKPLNVLDSVLNYVNASFMNQMNNENNDAITIKPEVDAAEQAFSSKLRRYDGAQVWRIVVQNDKERKLADELQIKYDGQLWKEVKQEVDYLLKPNVLADAEQYVKAANLSRIVLIDNLQKVIEVENPPPEEIAEYQYRKAHRLTWIAYHRLDDIHDFYDTMARTYPLMCSVEIIGYSIEKRPLKILKISNGNANNPSVWIDGGMHAREWISPAVVTFVANQIIEGWEDLPAYMRNINWYVHAVANPDGYEYSHTTDRLWRKNMRSHGRACPGVDLNRNFGYKWGGKGTSANPCAQTYRGSKAFSEPETFYISKFISSFPRDTFKAYLSFHSYGQYILYPWGYDYHITKDMADLDLVARQAGTIITKSSGAKYTVGSSATTLYPAAGGSDDWAKGIAGIKYSYTIEMGDTGRYGFVLPAEYIEPNGRNGYTFVQTIGKAITMGKNARRRKFKAHSKSH